MAKKKGKGKKKKSNVLKGVDRTKLRGQAKKESKKFSSGLSDTIRLPGGVESYQPEDGVDTFSVVPFVVQKNKALMSDVEPGLPYFRVRYAIHRDVGPEGKWAVCPSRTFGRPCPVCEERNKMKTEGAEYDDLKGLNASVRDLYLVVHKDRLKLLDYARHNFGKMLDIEIDDLEEDDSLFFLPEDGVDLRVKWATESAGDFKVRQSQSIKFRDRKEDLDEDIIEKALEIDLAECVIELPYKTLHAMFHHADLEDEEEKEEEEEEEESEEEDKDDEDDVDDDDDDDEEDEEEDEEEEEEEEEDDDEEDDDEDDEDDEDEEPKKKKKKERAKKASDKKKKSKGKCPHGHTFGDDCDEKPECDGCAVWDDCFQASP